ncbi:hypothetical protein K0M31_016957 [Melipona bicolor]|uniref:Uncharacterized protein n=1 Tax=Melipona bicolor TaxID=60889 RepID=A0AA40KEH8_9HYME|nr:hypothetical protein K0M31_016957 [Melipona bicolor]
MDERRNGVDRLEKYLDKSGRVDETKFCGNCGISDNDFRGYCHSKATSSKNEVLIPGTHSRHSFQVPIPGTRSRYPFQDIVARVPKLILEETHSNRSHRREPETGIDFGGDRQKGANASPGKEGWAEQGIKSYLRLTRFRVGERQRQLRAAATSR